MYSGNMVCFRHVVVYTLRSSDNKYDDDDYYYGDSNSVIIITQGLTL